MLTGQLTGLESPQVPLLVHQWWTPNPGMWHNPLVCHCDNDRSVGRSLLTGKQTQKD